MKMAQPVLIVRSMPEAIAWYEDVLGFEVSFRNEVPGEPSTLNYAVLGLGTAEIHLGLERDMENPAGQGAWNLVTDHFADTLERCRETGVVFFIEPSEIPTEQRTFGIKDPDGNLVTLVEAR